MLQFSNIQILLINFDQEECLSLVPAVWHFLFDANERVTTSFTGYVGFFNLYTYTRKRSLFIYFALYYSLYFPCEREKDGPNKPKSKQQKEEIDVSDFTVWSNLQSFMYRVTQEKMKKIQKQPDHGHVRETEMCVFTD